MKIIVLNPYVILIIQIGVREESIIRKFFISNNSVNSLGKNKQCLSNDREKLEISQPVFQKGRCL